jgi:acetyl-CoA carboxylase carboxyl transferase subunit beta
MSSRSAREWIGLLFDGFDASVQTSLPSDPLGFPDYLASKRSASSASGELEAVIWGEAQMGKVEVTAAVFEFGYLGGSMGIAVGSAIEAAMKDSLERSVPFVAVTASGGARMQEGMAALAQMPRTIAASTALAAAGIPRIAVLGNPTTGGVYASFTSLSDLIIAESGATIGFAGPRVVGSMTGAKLPEASHTADAALEAGLVDEVADGKDIRKWLTKAVSILVPSAPLKDRPPPTYPPSRAPAPASAWEAYWLTRHADRPSPSVYLRNTLDHLVELKGDRAGGDDPAVFCAVARVGDIPVVIAALDRASPTASGFRKCRRAIELAGKLRFPMLTIVDTPGANPLPESEYSGLASEIAKTFRDLLSVDVPVVCAITGEGGSGGALALACGDIIGIQKNAVFSVISPEGASSILHRDPSRAEEISTTLKPTAHDLVRFGYADDIIGEPEGGAHVDPKEASARLYWWIREALERAEADPKARSARYSSDW